LVWPAVRRGAPIALGREEVPGWGNFSTLALFATLPALTLFATLPGLEADGLLPAALAFEDLGVLSSERACFEDFGVVLVGALSRRLFPAAFAATPPDFAGFGAGLDTGLGTGVGAAGLGAGSSTV